VQHTSRGLLVAGTSADVWMEILLSGNQKDDARRIDVARLERTNEKAENGKKRDRDKRKKNAQQVRHQHRSTAKPRPRTIFSYHHINIRAISSRLRATRRRRRRGCNGLRLILLYTSVVLRTVYIPRYIYT